MYVLWIFKFFYIHIIILHILSHNLHPSWRGDRLGRALFAHNKPLSPNSSSFFVRTTCYYAPLFQFFFLIKHNFLAIEAIPLPNMLLCLCRNKTKRFNYFALTILILPCYTTITLIDGSFKINWSKKTYWKKNCAFTWEVLSDRSVILIIKNQIRITQSSCLFFEELSSDNKYLLALQF